MSKTIVFDFDGVIHSYTSGWCGEAVIADPPVEGIKEVIDSLREKDYEVVIVSSRSNSTLGRLAMEEWLKKYNIIVDKICIEKPPALVYIDDRAICFDGDCKSLINKIETFKPWNKK